MDDNNEKGGVNSTLLPERIPESWEICQIQDILERVSNRVDPDKIESQDYISLKHMGKGEPRVRKCGTSDEVSSKKYRFSEGDILFGKLRPYFRKVALSKTEGVCSTDINVIKSTEKVDRDFLFYTLFRQDFINIADKTSTGTRMPRADWKKLDELKIALPSLEEQEKISQILYKIDSKVEINNGVNEILEEMAQATFKSWFADFQPFDDFKTSKFGKIPESFTISNLTDITDIVLGGTPDSDEDSYWDGDIVWAKTKDVSNEEEAFISSTEESITKEGLEESSTEIAPKDSTIITARGTVGQLAMPAFDMAINQSSYSLVAERDTDDYFIYCLMNNILNNLTSRTHGTVFDTITKSTLNEQEIVLPPAEQREKFDQIVEPLMEKIKKNQKENKYLEELRDTLLPKLMSGEIRVNDIELDELEVDSEV